MTDRLFFATAFLAAVALVGLALLPGLNQRPSGPVSGGGTDYKRIEVSGDQLNRVVAGGDAEIDLVEVNGQTVLRIGAKAGVLAPDPLMGPHFTLAPDLEVAFAGRQIKVTVTARAADKYGASGVRLNYLTGTGDDSGWQELPLTRQFEDVSFVYRPPERDESTDPGYDYIAVRPQIPEDRRAVFISSLVFEVVSNTRNDAGQ